MDAYDVKRERRDLYAPGRDFEEVVVPEMGFLAVDGHGDPNTSRAYAEAVEALYGVAYQVRFLAKKGLGRVHVVAPLEGLWTAADLSAFVSGDRSQWEWTMMIGQPEWITDELVERACALTLEKKGLPAVGRLRFAPYDEGRSVQVLHVGPYTDEGPVIARLHEEYLPAHGLRERGHHHEIYLSDPRKVAAEKLRTILRQPVEPVA